MTATTTIAFASEAFAKRLANLLSDQRDLSGRSVRALARSSGGRFTAKELRAIEAGESPLSEPLAVDLSALYGVDLGEIVQERLPLVIRPHGVVSTGGVSASFTPHDSTSLLVSYLRLVRRLRNAEEVPSITLRRDDVESLAAYLDLPGERVIERLAGLMGATRVQRRAMVAMFVAGAVVIGLVGTAAAAIREPVRSSSAPDPSTPRVTVADAAASVLPTVPSSARAVFDVATGRVTVVDTQASDTALSDAPAPDPTNNDAAASAIESAGGTEVSATSAPVPTAAGGASAGARRSTAVPTTGLPTAEEHPDPSSASPEPAPAPPDGGSTVDPPSGADAAAVAAEAARLAAERDAAVIAAAQTAADADAARLAAEQAAAQAKADRIAAERAAAEASAGTTTTTTAAPTVTTTV